MTLTRYRYSGPRSACALRTADGLLEAELIPGRSVELPADHEYTQVLLCLKQLTPEVAAAKAVAKKEGGKA